MEKFSLPIGGFIKQSLIDYPGHIASVVFLCGCNMRCFYCHNPQLVLPRLIKKQPLIEVDKIITWIEKNVDLLDAVVITGGEPTLHSSLPLFLQYLRSLSLAIKLDTNGTNSRMLAYLIENRLVDYVAMDIKAPLELDRYRMVCGDDFSDEYLQEVKKSMHIIQQGAIGYEFRTTLNHTISLEDVLTIIDGIRGNYFLQLPNTNPQHVLEPGRMGHCRVDIQKMHAVAQIRNDVIVKVR